MLLVSCSDQSRLRVPSIIGIRVCASLRCRWRLVTVMPYGEAVKYPACALFKACTLQFLSFFSRHLKRCLHTEVSLACPLIIMASVCHPRGIVSSTPTQSGRQSALRLTTAFLADQTRRRGPVARTPFRCILRCLRSSRFPAPLTSLPLPGLQEFSCRPIAGFMDIMLLDPAFPVGLLMKQSSPNHSL